MEADTVCFPAPLGCFKLPAGRLSSAADSARDDEFADEFILSDASLLASLKKKDPEGCFLCLAESIGDEE